MESFKHLPRLSIEATYATGMLKPSLPKFNDLDLLYTSTEKLFVNHHIEKCFRLKLESLPKISALFRAVCPGRGTTVISFHFGFQVIVQNIFRWPILSGMAVMSNFCSLMYLSPSMKSVRGTNSLLLFSPLLHSRPLSCLHITSFIWLRPQLWVYSGLDVEKAFIFLNITIQIYPKFCRENYWDLYLVLKMFGLSKL